jgi:hypothetical protein
LARQPFHASGGRTLPDLPADMLFDTDERHAAFIFNKKPVPKQVPKPTP